MINVTAMPASEVPCFIAEQCRVLCHDGSEMQGLFDRIALLSLRQQDHAARIAYCWRADDDDGPDVAGWACVSEWVVGDETRIQAQAFVADGFRRRGIATALLTCLTHDLPRERLPVAVFSPECFRIAQRLGWNATEYRLVDDGWIGVGTVERRESEPGPDEE